MDKKIYLTKQFLFSAAHRLINYQGPCANLHGHTYKLEVTICGAIQKNGMVIDFGKLKEIVMKRIIEKLDHSYLNDLFAQPTAENMVVWIWKRLEDQLEKKGVQLVEVKLWETPTSLATYRNEKKKESTPKDSKAGR